MNNENPYRKDFPLLEESSVIYLDSAATAQKPACVLQAERDFYERYYANPMRGFYALSIEATNRLEEARDEVRDLINAPTSQEIVFTRNATESLNLVAYSYGLSRLKPGDEIVVSIMEHHSNLLPWQMVAKKTGAVIKYLECEPDGRITQERLDAAFSDRTRLVAIVHVSNVLGCKNPISRIVAMARERGAVVVLDAAQSAPHIPVDVQALGVDFLAFSGHKLMGPMGIGVLYGRRELLDEMPPFLTGGEMIDSVTRTEVKFAPAPHKFEAGTVNAAGAWGLREAIRYLKKVGFEEIHRRELEMTTAALDGLKKIPHIHVLGSEKADEHCGILTFTVDGVHSHDVSAILDADRIAVRAGHHCAQPLMEYLNLNSATRASIYFYNTQEEIETFIKSAAGIRRKMGYGE